MSSGFKFGVDSFTDDRIKKNQQTKVFTTIGANNHSTRLIGENDIYTSPPEAVEKLLRDETFNKNIWENACGLKHITGVLKQKGYNVRSSDIFPWSDDIEELDFLETNEEWDGDIITNPPANLDFIKKSIETVKTGNKVAMLLKLTFLESRSRYELLFSKYPPKKIKVFINRITCGKNGEFNDEEGKPLSSAVCYAWYIWEKGWHGKPEIEWI